MKKEILESIAPLVPFEESGFSFNDEHYYSARSLYDQAKKEKAKPYFFQLDSLDFSQKVFRETERLTDLAYHFRRAMEADCSIPIIVGPLGNVLDGYHRILKSVITGEKVSAYRLRNLPQANIHTNKDK